MHLRVSQIGLGLGLAIGLGLALGACGPKPAPSPTHHADPLPGVVEDTRSEFEKRLDTACKALGPPLTACAVEDAKAAHAEGRVSKAKLDEITKPNVQAALTADWNKKCYLPDKRTSRQVRVLEVCFAEEKQCAALIECLANLSASPKD